MDQETFDAYVKAGKIAAQALEHGKSLIKKGASLLKVTEAVEKKIVELGGDFAFPPQISLNDIAALKLISKITASFTQLIAWTGF